VLLVELNSQLALKEFIDCETSYSSEVFLQFQDLHYNYPNKQGNISHTMCINQIISEYIILEAAEGSSYLLAEVVRKRS